MKYRHIVTVNSMNGEEYKISVYPTDTVKDFKRLLANELQCIQPQALRLQLNHKPLTIRDDYRSLEHISLVETHDKSRNTSVPFKQPLLYFMFCFPTDSNDILNHGEIHRSSCNSLMSLRHDCVDTLQKNLEYSVRKWPNNRLFGTRIQTRQSEDNKSNLLGSYKQLTYREAQYYVRSIALGLLEMDINPGDRLGIISENRVEWQLVDHACFLAGIVSVPLYDTYGSDSIAYILEHAEIKACVSGRKQLNSLRNGIRKLNLETQAKILIILMDEGFDKDSLVSKYYKQTSSSPLFTTLSHIQRLGANLLQKKTSENSNKYKAILGSNNDPDSIAKIQYTSGTTGQPKGVIITHRNLLVAANGLSLRTPSDFIDGQQVFMSFLPLAHSYGNIVEIIAISQGNAIGFFSGDVTNLVEDIRLLKPTYMPGVPRVWQKIYDRIQSEISALNPFRKQLFWKAFNSQLHRIKAGRPRSDLQDKIVFRKISQRFGGRLKVFTSGAAPLLSKIADFLQVCLCARFVEGYGLSETNSTCTCLSVFDIEYGHVGSPLSINEIKLVSVPEMDYLIIDKPLPRGEIQIRGPNVFKKYYKNEEETHKSFDENGQFKTGDIGMQRLDGNLQIIDRKKNIFKLAQGEYIRPEYIENVYKTNRFISNIFVYGNSLRSYLVAIVVPDFDQVREYLAANNERFDEKEHQLYKKKSCELVKNLKLNRFILSELKRTGESENFQGFEHVKKIALIDIDFGEISGGNLLTPSMKLKRKQAFDIFQHKIKQMYENNTLKQIKNNNKKNLKKNILSKI